MKNKETLKDIQKEAEHYDLSSLVQLQIRRQSNIALFEDSIRNERMASQQEAEAEFLLSSKLRLHNTGVSKLDAVQYNQIIEDIPKLQSTQKKREQTINLLKAAILEEQEMMDREEKMIKYLEIHHGGKS